MQVSLNPGQQVRCGTQVRTTKTQAQIDDLVPQFRRFAVYENLCPRQGDIVRFAASQDQWYIVDGGMAISADRWLCKACPVRNRDQVLVLGDQRDFAILMPGVESGTDPYFECRFEDLEYVGQVQEIRLLIRVPDISPLLNLGI